MVDCQRRGDTLVVVPMRERVAVDAVVTHASAKMCSTQPVKLMQAG